MRIGRGRRWRALSCDCLVVCRVEDGLKRTFAERLAHPGRANTRPEVLNGRSLCPAEDPFRFKAFLRTFTKQFSWITSSPLLRTGPRHRDGSSAPMNSGFVARTRWTTLSRTSRIWRSISSGSSPRADPRPQRSCGRTRGTSHPPPGWLRLYACQRRLPGRSTLPETIR